MVVRLCGVEDNIDVDYPLFLLKGSFSCPFGCRPNVTGTDCCVYSNTPAAAFSHVCFKCLVSLARGLNRITIRCPHSSCCLRINGIKPSGRGFYVRFIYVTFSQHDGSFQAPPDVECTLDSACKRLGLAARLLQTLTAETVFTDSGQRRTFVCAGDSEVSSQSTLPPHQVASPTCAAVWCVKSDLSLKEAQCLSQKELWAHLAREIDRHFEEDRGLAKWLAVASCTEYQPISDSDSPPFEHEKVIRRTKGYCALGTGGLALVGSGTMYTWPEELRGLMACLSNTRTIDRRKYLDDSAYRGTYWANYTTALGTMMHELGHCFDLDHALQGFMRRGGDDLNLHFAFRPLGSNQCVHAPAPVSQPRYRLSIYQFERILFFENATCEISETPPDNVWDSCDSPHFCGEAFWGKEIAEFLALHQWFTGSADRKTDCEIVLHDGILSSSKGIQLVQIRVSGEACSGVVEASSGLALNNRLLDGLIVWHQRFDKPRNDIPILKIIRSSLSQLHVSGLKVVAIDRNGSVFQKRIQ